MYVKVAKIKGLKNNGVYSNCLIEDARIQLCSMVLLTLLTMVKHFSHVE
jgi:ABC-type dipeptide/oligopeptide/nickel transport system permease component